MKSCNAERMKISHGLSRISTRALAIHHRIIRRQVHRGSRQLGKLEGVVFYFGDARGAPPPVSSARFFAFQVSFLHRFLPRQPFLPFSSSSSSSSSSSRSSFVNATESESRRQMSRVRKRHSPKIFSSSARIFFSPPL